MKVITVKEVEYIAFRLAKNMLAFDEPIPDFSSRFPNILESCLATPFQRFSKKSLYPTLISKAAILFYLLIKNHPFQNGNKRIAMTTLLVFLYRNKKWIKVDTQELYNFTVWVAQSPRTVKNETVKAIQKFLKTHLVGLEI
ncbi:MAG: type II toxin-antitoxin system death-on-curing family toxin [Planctomycetes bacterium]|nr:type II toxin-antitoxin system death-on-curing family toxin [Planctomycetota bacterium]